MTAKGSVASNREQGTSISLSPVPQACCHLERSFSQPDREKRSQTTCLLQSLSQRCETKTLHAGAFPFSIQFPCSLFLHPHSQQKSRKITQFGQISLYLPQFDLICSLFG